MAWRLKKLKQYYRNRKKYKLSAVDASQLRYDIARIEKRHRSRKKRSRRSNTGFGMTGFGFRLPGF
jgi:hypothetical protein